jgi:hypothetical protein
MMPSQAIRDAAKKVVSMLVVGDYRGVARLTNDRRLSAAEIQNAIKEYGRTLKMPSDQEAADFDAVLVEGSDPPRWHVRVDLWTVEEGRSDLSVLMWISEGSPNQDVELLDIHVL